MKKTRKYLTQLPSKAILPMLESLEQLKTEGNFPKNDNSGLRFVASMLRDEVGIFDITGKTAQLVRDEVCRRFIEDHKTEGLEIKLRELVREFNELSPIPCASLTNASLDDFAREHNLKSASKVYRDEDEVFSVDKIEEACNCRISEFQGYVIIDFNE